MRCVIKDGGVVTVEPSEKLVAAENYCVFEVKACGICGSDLPRVFSGASYFYPIVLGHEFSGVVKDSTNPELIGKRACVFPILPCGECEFCREQRWANCVGYDYYGSRRDGGMQSELLIKESNLIFLPDGVSYDAGAMIEPAAVCLHAVKKLGITEATRVLVYGAGTIGLLAAAWAKALGAAQVYISDPNEERRAFAEAHGFAVYSGETVDAVIEASGAAAALNDGIEKCAPFGRIVLVGHGKADVTLRHDIFVKILRKQLTLFGSWNSDFTDRINDWQESVDAIAAGKLHPETLITHKFTIESSPSAFEMIKEGKEFYNKILLVN